MLRNSLAQWDRASSKDRAPEGRVTLRPMWNERNRLSYGCIAIAALLGHAFGCSSDGDTSSRGGAAGNVGGVGAAATGGVGGGFQNAPPVMPGGDHDAALDGGGLPDRFVTCGKGGDCGPGLACRYEHCVPDPSACKNGNDCIQDSYCDEHDECIPFGIPADVDHDESCRVDITVDSLSPQVQCRWEGPPAGDLNPTNIQAMATPVVVDFDFDENPDTLHPSIVFPTFPATGTKYHEPGTLRVVDGNDCTQQFSLAPAVMAPASAAVGDLNGDGRAEIVAVKTAGGIVAWEYRPATKTFEVLFNSTDVAGGADKWNGPALHDLDDDGIPEIIYGGVVYDAKGVIIDNTLGVPTGADTSSTIKGYVSVVADVDEDGKMELVRGNAIHEWDVALKKWVAEPYFKPPVALSVGQVAVADFGNYPIAALGGIDVAEIVVIEAGSARVQSVDGTVIKKVTMPGTGRGGPPTVADFDGDGKAEFASANGTRYDVFDLDCTMKDANCEANGVLWSQPSQDGSSNVTGSSVFDFDADGAAEVVYADECYLRMYDGKTGAVRYSAARSSGTTYENPVVADVDGDFNTEIVSTVNGYAELGCAATDPLFPPATFAQHTGIVVLRDETDRWASSRPVWNQHPYAVTHVGDHGETPKTSAVLLNWRTMGLNNFRQNVQGDLEADGQPDLTVSGDARKIQCEGTVGRLEAEICNRGTKPMGSGTDVAFHKGDATGPELCAIPIPEILSVGECTRVSCEADLGQEHIDMTVVVDPHDDSAECWENNNIGLFMEVACGEVPVPELPVVD